MTQPAEIKKCEWCDAVLPKKPGRERRFCNYSCNAHWRHAHGWGCSPEARQGMRENCLKMRSRPDVQAKRRAYLDSEKGRSQLKEGSKKGTDKLRALGFPGMTYRNGHGPTVPQKVLFDALSEATLEHPVATGERLKVWKIDIAIPRLQLAIEVDGRSHRLARNKEIDSQKEQFLKGRGWTLLRFWNEEILRDLPSVLRRIYATIASLETRKEPAQALKQLERAQA